MRKYIFALSFLWACSTGSEQALLSAQEFQKKLSETPGAILLDVRRPEEIAVERIENSVNIVFDDSFGAKLDDLEQKPLFVYCASGKRSAKAADILLEKGYKNVYTLDGGLGAWKEAGLTLDQTQK
jgi:rhodanese-related sulfurtransferase